MLAILHLLVMFVAARIRVKEAANAVRSAWYDFAYVILRELEQAFCISQGSQLNSPLH